MQVFWGFEVFTYPSEMVRDMEHTHTHTQELKMWWNDPAERLFNEIYLINNQKNYSTLNCYVNVKSSSYSKVRPFD